MNFITLALAIFIGNHVLPITVTLLGTVFGLAWLAGKGE